jgi:uncharacterized protein YkwD
LTSPERKFGLGRFSYMRAGMLAVVGVVQGLLLLSPGVAAASTACPGDEGIPTAASTADAAKALVCDINVIRERNDVHALRWNDTVARPAQAFAQELAARRSISHVGGDGSTVKDRIFATGYFDGFAAWLVLENVDWGSSAYSTPLATVLGWMQSTEHRRNLLDPQAEEIGIGVAPGELDGGPGNGFFYVADFAARGRNAKPRQHARANAKKACKSRTKRARKRCRSKTRV